MSLRIADDSSLAAFLTRAAQAASETLGLAPHPNQLVAAAGLVRGFLIELDTDEGKTLVGALAAAGLALAGRQVHVLTANDYLARRDAEWMEPFYSALGLSSGAVLSTSTLAEKRAGYSCDVTYAAAREVGFDVLRDRLAKDVTLRTGARHDAVVLDEADAILLDEARMPLVLAGERPHCPSTLAHQANAAFETLTPGKDFVMAGDNLTAQFTDAGLDALESCWPDVDLLPMTPNH